MAETTNGDFPTGPEQLEEPEAAFKLSRAKYVVEWLKMQAERLGFKGGSEQRRHEALSQELDQMETENPWLLGTEALGLYFEEVRAVRNEYLSIPTDKDPLAREKWLRNRAEDAVDNTTFNSPEEKREYLNFYYGAYESIGESPDFPPDANTFNAQFEDYRQLDQEVRAGQVDIASVDTNSFMERIAQGTNKIISAVSNATVYPIVYLQTRQRGQNHERLKLVPPIVIGVLGAVALARLSPVVAEQLNSMFGGADIDLGLAEGNQQHSEMGDITQKGGENAPTGATSPAGGEQAPPPAENPPTGATSPAGGEQAPPPAENPPLPSGEQEPPAEIPPGGDLPQAETMEASSGSTWGVAEDLLKDLKEQGLIDGLDGAKRDQLMDILDEDNPEGFDKGDTINVDNIKDALDQIIAEEKGADHTIGPNVNLYEAQGGDTIEKIADRLLEARGIKNPEPELRQAVEQAIIDNNYTYNGGEHWIDKGQIIHLEAAQDVINDSLQAEGVIEQTGGDLSSGEINAESGTQVQPEVMEAGDTTESPQATETSFVKEILGSVEANGATIDARPGESWALVMRQVGVPVEQSEAVMRLVGRELTQLGYATEVPSFPGVYVVGNKPLPYALVEVLRRAALQVSSRSVI